MAAARHGLLGEVDPAALRRTFVVDREKVIPIGFLVRGPEYKIWGLVPMTMHFFGPLNPNDPVYLLGTDKLGRDLLSRLIYATRVSMSIGLIGVTMSLTPRRRARHALGLLRRLGGPLIQR